MARISTPGIWLPGPLNTLNSSSPTGQADIAGNPYFMGLNPGKMIVLANTDAPGVIGRVGTLLGKAGVNIADMRVGRRSPHGEAVMVLNVDEAVSAAVRAELALLDGIRRVHWVEI